MTIKEDVKDAVKISRKTFFNPRAWLGYDLLKEHTQAVWALIKRVFIFEKPTEIHDESFTEALKRLNLTEATVQRLGKSYFEYAMFFLITGIAAVVVAFAFLLHVYILDFFISLAVGFVLFAQAFKYHFWHFQIKHKKLGCTFAEWRQGKVTRGGS